MKVVESLTNKEKVVETLTDKEKAKLFDHLMEISSCEICCSESGIVSIRLHLSVYLSDNGVRDFIGCYTPGGNGVDQWTAKEEPLLLKMVAQYDLTHHNKPM